LFERGQIWASGDDHVHPEADQLGSEAGEALRLALRRTRLGDKMLSIHVAELVQSAQECVDERVPGLGPDHARDLERTEEPDPIDLARRLGGGRAGQREGPEGHAHEGAPIHHSITSSVQEPSRHRPTGTCAVRECGERPR
jgi:hypothetical protein